MTTYEIHANLEMLKSAFDEGALLEQLDAPLRSMVSGIVSRAEAEPLSIYLCSSDHDVDSRNFLGYVLALWIRKRIPTVLLVDCDYLSTGLSGVVPHRDALGFLDLLLYGTSLGVITQESNAGVSVIGAGSFPVTKKSPFALDAFDNTRRYLNAHSKCVVFCGPVLDDEESVHAIAAHVDLTILVNVADRFRAGVLDPLENSVVSTAGSDAWSIRINTRVPIAPVAPVPAEGVSLRTPEPQREEEETTTLVAEVEGLVDKVPERVVDAKEAAPDGQSPARGKKAAEIKEPMRVEQERIPASGQKEETGRPVEFATATAKDEPDTRDFAGPTSDKKTRSSRWLRIVTPVVGIFLIAFVVWWLYLTKSVREREQNLADMTAQSTVTEPETQPADTVGTVAPGSVPTTDAGETEPVVTEDTQTVPSAEPASAHDPDIKHTNGVPLAERLDDYANKYLVHVSSFRRLDRARDEALYLMGWNYPVFLYRIDLGGKGIWYRVYVGPSDTREEAMAHKIKLDENPRIQSTRIARVPG